VLGVVELGEQLSTAKELLAGHKGGSYGKWLKSVKISRTTAHRSVQVWERLGGCSNVAQLDLSAAYALAASSTPEAAVQDVLALTEDGRVDAKQVRTIIAKHRPANRNRPSGPAPIVVQTASGSVAIKRTDVGVTAEIVLLEALDAIRHDSAAA